MNTFCLLALVLAPGAQESPLAVANAVVDCGEVRAGIPLLKKFRVTNRGPHILKVTDLAPVICGCVQPRMNVRALLPGESAEVALDINTLAQPAGANSWKAILRFRTDPGGGAAGVSGEQLLEVKAVVVREVSIDPVALSLIVDGPVSHKLTVRDRRAKPLNITRARSASPHLKAEIASAATDGAGNREQGITLSVLDSLPAGQIADMLVIETDDPEYRDFRIPVQITRKSAKQVAAMPEQAAFKLASGQRSATMLLRLRDPEGRRVTVERIEADHAAIRTKWAAGPENLATLRITIETDPKAMDGLGTVKVHLSEPANQAISIPVSWQGP